MVSFTKKIADSKDGIIYEVIGKDAKSRDAYYFIKIPASKDANFNQALVKGEFNLGDYGVIVSSGFGKDVPDAVRQNVINGNITYEGN